MNFKEIVVEQIYAQYKIEIKALLAAVFERGFAGATRHEILGSLNQLAELASPLITIITLVILVLTIIKMIDRFIETKYHFSIFRMRKIKKDENGQADKV